MTRVESVVVVDGGAVAGASKRLAWDGDDNDRELMLLGNIGPSMRLFLPVSEELGRLW